MNLEAVIGLEVHAQLLTESKIFCGCKARFGAEPNSNTCPVCLGLPGALPVLNEKAVELALRAAVALHCDVPSYSIFARKNYFYPDLPKGYQISQYDQPIGLRGQLEISVEGRTRIIRLTRIHMEEDAGKLLHEGVEEGSTASYVDLNRAGVPLIEIVTEPDIRTPAEAYSYLTELKSILQYTGVSLANMEEGNLRCDANISLRPSGAAQFGSKVEIKNLNSFKNVQKALEFEIHRQSELLQSGKDVAKETRLFDANSGKTASMRSKEEAHDYRYFPDPDLLPVQISAAFLEEIRSSLPELPARKRARFLQDFQLGANEVEVLIEDRARAERFEQAASLSGNPRQAANWILKSPEAAVSPAHIAELVSLVDKGAINSDQAKVVFNELIETGASPAAIVKARGMAQISDTSELAGFIDRVLQRNPDLVSRYKNGETKLLGVLVGQVMKESAGKANPATVSKLMQGKLGG